ncbi:transposase [Streptomyces mirabilis]|uniref:transposase n=1 Tax=Streptomyces mirabilis TaxID=68239 RepID=UPI0034118C4C
MEQVIADIKNGPFAHAPSGHFQANAAWLALAALAHNLTRAAGTLASAFHARATTATLRDHLIDVPARLGRSARRLVLHLPQHWPWADDPSSSTPFMHPHPPPDLPQPPRPQGPETCQHVEKPGRPAASPCPPRRSTRPANRNDHLEIKPVDPGSVANAV